MSTKKSKPAVKIWFEGLPQPIPARVEHLADSQLLTVELPYLKRNTEVFVSDAEGDSSKGFMTEVSLVAGPEPKLQLLVQTGQPVFEPISELPLMSDEGGGLESVEVGEEPAPLATDLEHHTSTVPLLTPLDEVAAPAPAPPDGDREETLPERRVEERRLRDRREATTRLPAPPQELQRPPSRRWWGLGAVVLALVGGALLIYHEVQQPAVGVAQAAARPATEAAPAPTPEEPAPAPPVKHEAKNPVATPAPWTPPAEDRPPVDRTAPRVWLGGKHPVMVVPVEGSTRGAEHYALGNPNGVAINLPHAKLNDIKPMYKFEAGAFRLLNVWGRKDGVHLRLFFHSKVPTYKLHFDPDAVRVTVYPR